MLTLLGSGYPLIGAGVSQRLSSLIGRMIATGAVFIGLPSALLTGRSLRSNLNQGMAQCRNRLAGFIATGLAQLLLLARRRAIWLLNDLPVYQHMGCLF